ncbi:MAG: GDSL-type esterase/lipase family protein [Bacteroidales bacterium]|nr:GDSL-type esterase/lipase family protein [Bacteroidales bacterium]
MERFICTLIIALAVFTSSAQNQTIDVVELPFANFEADTLSFDEETSCLIDFFQKFDSVVTTKTGNINIVQIGASHIQAGTMSHRIRQNLLLSFPDLIADRGLIFPYSAAQKCNNPSDYSVRKSNYFSLIRNVYKNIEKPLGVSGIAVYCQDSAADLQIVFRDSLLKFTTNRITLLGYSDSNKVIPTVILDSVEMAPTFIDSALRRFCYDIPIISDSFSIHFPCDTGEFFTLTGIFLENDLPGITFSSIGVNGASVTDYLRCDYFVRDLELLQPDMVIFGIGINDASKDDFDTIAFKNNYLQLIDSVRKINPDCAFVFFTNNDSYKRIAKGKYSVNKNGLSARDVFYRLAAQTEGAVWDQFDIMGGLKSMEQWRQKKLAKFDRVHFTNEGYNLIGDLFFNAWIHAYNKTQNAHN